LSFFYRLACVISLYTPPLGWRGYRLHFCFSLFIKKYTNFFGWPQLSNFFFFFLLPFCALLCFFLSIVTVARDGLSVYIVIHIICNYRLCFSFSFPPLSLFLSSRNHLAMSRAYIQFSSFFRNPCPFRLLIVAGLYIRHPHVFLR